MKLPNTVPFMTNWVDFKNTSVTNLCGISHYFDKKESSIAYLDLYSAKIDIICDETLAAILKSANMKSLNLAQNKIRRFPIMLNQTVGSLEQLWLSGNPVQCDCDMLWLISWLNNTRVSGQRLVQDYQDVICKGGKWDGISVYKLDKVLMGCYPNRVAQWIVIVSSVISGLMLFFVIITIIIHRKWNAVRWIIYKNFDKLLGDPDRNENIENMEFDAFLSFW